MSSNLESATLPKSHWAGDPERDEGVLRVEVPEGSRVEPTERQVEIS